MGIILIKLFMGVVVLLMVTAILPSELVNTNGPMSLFYFGGILFLTYIICNIIEKYFSKLFTKKDTEVANKNEEEDGSIDENIEK